MKWLVRLYPRAWRERYEEEFLAPVQERGLSAGDITNVVLGAVYARARQLERGLGSAVRQVPWSTLALLSTVFLLAGIWLEQSLPTRSGVPTAAPSMPRLAYAYGSHHLSVGRPLSSDGPARLHRVPPASSHGVIPIPLWPLKKRPLEGLPSPHGRPCFVLVASGACGGVRSSTRAPIPGALQSLH